MLCRIKCSFPGKKYVLRGKHFLFFVFLFSFSFDSASVEHVVVQLLYDKPQELVFHGVKASIVK